MSNDGGWLDHGGGVGSRLTVDVLGDGRVVMRCHQCQRWQQPEPQAGGGLVKVGRVCAPCSSRRIGELRNNPSL